MSIPRLRILCSLERLNRSYGNDVLSVRRPVYMKVQADVADKVYGLDD